MTCLMDLPSEYHEHYEQAELEVEVEKFLDNSNDLKASLAGTSDEPDDLEIEVSEEVEES